MSCIPGISSLVELLGQRARLTPDEVAYIFLADGGESDQRITYAELDARARAIGAHLQTGRRVEGKPVLLLFQPGIDYICAFYGCLYGGAIPVPAYPPSSARQLPRLQAILTDARSGTAFTTTADLERIAAMERRSARLSVTDWIRMDELPRSGAAWRDPGLDERSLAFLQYTSGSTGLPKGVMVSQRNVVSNMELVGRRMGARDGDVVLFWLPPYHDFGLIGGILYPLIWGHRAVLMRPAAFLVNPYRWLKAIGDFGATITGGPNFAFDLCVRKIGTAQRATLDLRRLRVVFNGAEPIRGTTLRAFGEAFGPCGFRSQSWLPAYGLAEATLMVSGRVQHDVPAETAAAGALVSKAALARDEVAAPAGDADAAALISSGPALDETEIAIVDPATRIACPPDRIGEIWVRGPSIAQGYWGREALSAETFGAVVADSGDGPYMRTGDLGFLRQGELHVCGRLKDLIIIRGRNLFPQDLEKASSEADPRLRMDGAAAFALDDGPTERLVVVQELEFRAAPDPALFGAIAAEVFEQSGVIPDTVVLLKAGHLPRTSSGKVQRQLCKQQFLEQKLDVAAQWRRAPCADPSDTPSNDLEQDTMPQPPATTPIERAAQIERTIAAILGELLQADPRQVGRDAPLLELGADSLVLGQAVRRIEELYGVPIAVRQLFDELSSVAALAAFIAAHASAGRCAAAAASVPASVPASDPASVPASLSAPAAPAMPPAAPGETPTYPATAAQRRLLVLHRLDPASTAYQFFVLLPLPEAAYRAAVERALSAIVARHESLRTVCVPDGGGQVRMRVNPAAPVELRERHMASEAELRAHGREFAARPFDLTAGPLFRADMLRTWDGRVLLAWCMHEIVADGSAGAILERELMLLLQADLERRHVDLPALPVQYRDFAVRQHELLRTDREHPSRAYWHARLDADMPRVQLPFDYPPLPSAPTSSALYRFGVGGPVFAGIKSLCHEQRSTLFMFLQAALSVWLARLSGQRDIVIAAPVAGRDAADVASLIGFFLNTVLLRTPVAPEASFEQVLASSREIALQALEHQHYPFEQLIEERDLPRPANQFPVTPVLLNVRSYLGKHRALDDAGARHAPADQDARVELELTVQEHADGLAFTCQYRQALFKPETIAYLMGQWIALLEQAVRAPRTPVRELALFDRAPLASPYLAFAGEPPAAPPPRPVLARLREVVARTPGQVALEWRDTRWTYAELDARSERIAGQLRQLGCAPGDVVALLLDQPLEHVAAVLGAMKAGGVFVTLDAADPEQRLRTLAGRVSPRWWIAEAATGAVLGTIAGQAQGIWLGAGTPAAALTPQAGQQLEPAPLEPATPAAKPYEPAPHDPCYLFFTSGSTGTPKPILGAAGSLAQFIEWEIDAFGLDAGCRVSQLTAPTFDAFLRDLFVPLCCGGTLCLPPQRKLAPDQLLAWLDAARVTLVHCVPSLLRALLAFVQASGAGRIDPGLLRTVCLSGEVVLPATVRDFRAAFGDAVELVNFYGASETTMIRCWHRIGPADLERGFIPVGKSIAATQVIVLDGNGQVCPTGVPGEIHVRSPFFSLGYYNDPVLTAEVFVPNPLRPGSAERVYRSGDMGVLLADGNLRYLGRRDGQVKVNGMRVEVGEIENALLSHPEIAEAAVVAHSGEDGATSLHAYVVAHGALPPDLRQFLAARMAQTALPHSITRLDMLPMTGSGKVDRKALGARPQVEAPSAVAYAAPATPTEQALAGLFGEVLGRARIGLHDDFFALGGHSLRALMVLARIRKRFDVDLPLRTLFEAPTVAGLAGQVDAVLATRETGQPGLEDALAEALDELASLAGGEEAK